MFHTTRNHIIILILFLDYLYRVGGKTAHKKYKTRKIRQEDMKRWDYDHEDGTRQQDGCFLLLFVFLILEASFSNKRYDSLLSDLVVQVITIKVNRKSYTVAVCIYFNRVINEILLSNLSLSLVACYLPIARYQLFCFCFAQGSVSGKKDPFMHLR